jgi:hypothetical protein
LQHIKRKEAREKKERNKERKEKKERKNPELAQPRRGQAGAWICDRCK